MSPLDPELLEAWATKGSDPEQHVCDWIRRGAPLGIEAPIPTCGIFPPAEANNPDFPGHQEPEDALAQMNRGEITNYSSVQGNVEEAKVELNRYRKAGFLVDVPEKVVKAEMGHGTISRLGLIIKEKPEGVKRRIILDLRRSGGNKKATLPEKIILPRSRDFLETVRNVYNMQRPHGRDEGYARELVVIDASDAFMSLAVEEKELPHTRWHPAWTHRTLPVHGLTLWLQDGTLALESSGSLISSTTSSHCPMDPEDKCRSIWMMQFGPSKAFLTNEMKR